MFRRRRILLAVVERSLRQKDAIPEGMIAYKTTVDAQKVLELLNGQPRQ